jgi:hypothetical protein
MEFSALLSHSKWIALHLTDLPELKEHFCSTGIYQDYRAHMITLEMFTKGFYILGFILNLTERLKKAY